VASHCAFVLHFLRIDGIEHLFMCLPDSSVSSLEKCLFIAFAIFKLSY
jgi:hypothetical protein